MFYCVRSSGFIFEILDTEDLVVEKHTYSDLLGLYRNSMLRVENLTLLKNNHFWYMYHITSPQFGEIHSVKTDKWIAFVQVVGTNLNIVAFIRSKVSLVIMRVLPVSADIFTNDINEGIRRYVISELGKDLDSTFGDVMKSCD